MSDNGYGSYGYGNGDYSRSYADDRQYTQSQYSYVQQPDLRYGHARQPYPYYGYSQQGHSRDGYQRPYSQNYGYGQQGYSRYGYQNPYESDCGNDYRGSEGGYVEDHVRSTFNPFPLPHFEKRIIRHYHPY